MAELTEARKHLKRFNDFFEDKKDLSGLINYGTVNMIETILNGLEVDLERILSQKAGE